METKNSGRVDPASFFDVVYRTFERAEKAIGESIDRFYKIGGFPVRLRFAGDTLIPYIIPALDHLSMEPTGTPSLTVCLWDSISTQTKMPPPPWCSDDYLPRGEIRGYSNNRIKTAFQLGGYTLSMFDRKSSTGLFWIHNAYKIPSYVSGAPLHVIFSWWASTCGLQLIHGAAVGTPTGGVLIVGKGGSGKSTTALSCLQHGFFYVGDDYVLVDEHLTVHSLYSSAKLNRDQSHRFPDLFSHRQLFHQSNLEKKLVFLSQTHPSQLATLLPIVAILLPKVTVSSNSYLEQATAAKVLAGLAPSTLFQLPGEDQRALHHMAKLVAQVPNYVLHLGSDLFAIPATIQEAIMKSKGDALR